jgi:hypothetical protein
MNESNGTAWADLEDGGEGITIHPFTFSGRDSNYFSQRVVREPYTGRVQFRDVFPDHNFVLVDLGSDPRPLETDPVELKRMRNQLFYFKASVLETRTWLFKELVLFEGSAEAADVRENAAMAHAERQASEGKRQVGMSADMKTSDVAISEESLMNHRNEMELLRLALKDFHVERSAGIGGGLFGCASPVYTYVFLCFLANCSGDGYLALLSVLALFFSNAGTLTCNSIYRLGSYRGFQVGRLVSLPIRLMLVVQAMSGVLGILDVIVNLGLGIEVFTVVSCAMLAVFDLRNDILQGFSRMVSTKFDIIDTLPGNVYICRKSSRMSISPAGGGSSLNVRFVGAENKKIKGLALIVNIGGLLVELSELNSREAESLKGNVLVYQTQTFDSECKEYESVKQRMAFEQDIQEQAERAALKRKLLLQKQNAKTAAEKKRMSVAIMGASAAEAAENKKSTAQWY